MPYVADFQKCGFKKVKQENVVKQGPFFFSSKMYILYNMGPLKYTFCFLFLLFSLYQHPHTSLKVVKSKRIKEMHRVNSKRKTIIYFVA